MEAHSTFLVGAMHGVGWDWVGSRFSGIPPEEGVRKIGEACAAWAVAPNRVKLQSAARKRKHRRQRRASKPSPPRADAVPPAAQPEPEPEPGGAGSPARPLNEPGRWDFFLSHGQAMAGDQVKALSQLLKQKGMTVWYDYDMASRDTAAMEEGVRCSDNFLLFLSGDPDMWDGGGKGKEGSWRLFSQLCRCGEAKEEEFRRRLRRGSTRYSAAGPGRRRPPTRCGCTA